MIGLLRLRVPGFLLHGAADATCPCGANSVDQDEGAKDRTSARAALPSCCRNGPTASRRADDIEGPDRMTSGLVPRASRQMTGKHQGKKNRTRPDAANRHHEARVLPCAVLPGYHRLVAPPSPLACICKYKNRLGETDQTAAGRSALHGARKGKRRGAGGKSKSLGHGTSQPTQQPCRVSCRHQSPASRDLASRFPRNPNAAVNHRAVIPGRLVSDLLRGA